MVMKVLKKVNAKVKFLNRQNKYLTARLNRLLCNALIQIHFVAHRGFTSWCLLLSKNLKNRLRLCAVHFRKINLLPVSERVKSCIATILNIGTRLYHHISMICLSFHTISTLLDHKWHWIYSYKE